jgi:hypothetical protein
MKQIRRNVFETNSSSTHSISIRKDYPLENSWLFVDDDGYIHAEFGEFGWEIESYTGQIDKLSYLLTMTTYFNDCDIWYADAERVENIERFMQTDDFKQISDAVAEYTGCKGIVIDDSSGYIDHQSVYCSTLDEFLNYNSTSILEFIFGGVVVHTDNDNY